MTLLVFLSRRINRRITGETVMLCATAHWRRWRIRHLFNNVFFWHVNHCFECFQYEKQVNMLYHEYILSELRKERTVQLELPLGLPPVRCEHCKQEVPQPFYVVKHFGTVTHQFPFCNQDHANEFYLARLRREERW